MLTTLLLAAALAPGAKAPTNTLCPVQGEKIVAGQATKVDVRGRSYFICCPACGPKLKADPEKYLLKDGTPRNAADHGGHKH